MNETRRLELLLTGTVHIDGAITPKTTLVIQNDMEHWFKWPMPGGDENEMIPVIDFHHAMLPDILAMGYGAVTDTLVVRLRR